MRNINELHPVLQKKIHKLIKLCESNGLKIGIGECLRTVEEQDALYAKGRTDKSSGIVTNAKGSTYSSMHQWGIAFDFYRNDGKGAFNDSDNFFSKVGRLGKSIGLEWGGSWSTFIDKPHFQLSDWGSTATRLKTIYGTPDNFFTTWKAIKITGQYSTKKAITLYEYTDGTFEKVKYSTLSPTLKKKCSKVDEGIAKINAGESINIIDNLGDNPVFGKLKSGYWIVIKRDDNLNVEEI